MIIELYALLAADCETEIHVGRIYVGSKEEADKIVNELTILSNKIIPEDQYVCEYRWEEVEMELTLSV